MSARVVHRLLVPFASAGRVRRGTGLIAPIALGAALAAVCAGSPDADDLFQQAVDICVRVDAPVLRARAEVAWRLVGAAAFDVGRDRVRVRRGSRRLASCSPTAGSTSSAGRHASSPHASGS